MKRTLYITIMLLMVIIQGNIVLAQSPQKISYQAIVRDEKGQLVTERTVGVRISILQGTESGTASYAETHRPLTNVNGLMIIEIGTGVAVSGTFAQIDWAKGPYFIKTECDTEGGSNYGVTGISQILSVPYALHAHTASTVTGPVNETDPVFTRWDKNYNDLSNKPNIRDSVRNNAVMLSGEQTIAGRKTFSNGIKGAIDADNKRVTNVADPVQPNDAVNKATLDELMRQLDELRNSTGMEAKDGDGNIYRGVKIGTQIWLAENLRTTKYNDGTPIPLVRDSATWRNLTTPAYCWYQQDSATHAANRFGAIYNWYVVNPTTNGNKNVCPVGWHVPTLNDLTIFTEYVQGPVKITEPGNTNWKVLNNRGTDEYGFTALPAGIRFQDGRFMGKGSATDWWSQTQENTTNARTLSITYLESLGLSIRNRPYQVGLPIRCVKN